MMPGPLGIEDTSPMASAPSSIAIRTSSTLLMQQTLTLTRITEEATSDLRSSLSQHRSRGRALVPPSFHGQHNKIVASRRDSFQRQALDDRNSLAEKNTVRHRRRRAELLGRQIVDPHQLHTSVGQQLSRIGSDVGEVVMKRGRMHPPAQRAPCAEDYAWRTPPSVPVQLGGVDRLNAVRNVDHSRGPDQRPE